MNLHETKQNETKRNAGEEKDTQSRGEELKCVREATEASEGGRTNFRFEASKQASEQANYETLLQQQQPRVPDRRFAQ